MIATARLDSVPFLASFPRAALRVIADRSIERRFTTGDIIFRAGETAPGLMVVLEGKVRVMRRAGDRAQIVHVERVGGTLVIRSILSLHSRRSCAPQPKPVRRRYRRS